jgi:hypothetical protein
VRAINFQKELTSKDLVAVVLKVQIFHCSSLSSVGCVAGCNGNEVQCARFQRVEDNPHSGSDILSRGVVARAIQSSNMC